MAAAIVLLATGEARAADGTLRCGDWATLDRGDLLIENDVWNRGAETDYEQCIFGGTRPGAPFGWSWRWPEGEGRVRSYPSVIHGFSPWRDASTRSSLPRRVDALGRISARFVSETRASGAGNLAFDLWLTRSQPPTPDAVAHEVMVWLERRGMAVHGEHLKNVRIRGAEYELWSGPARLWGYVAFVARTPNVAGELRLDSFLRYLVHEGFVSPHEWLVSIELGSEIVGGEGRTTFTRYEIEID